MSQRGLHAGMTGHISQPVSGMPRYLGELIWHPFVGASVIAECVTAASTATADKTTSYTLDVSGVGNIPVDGSVVGLTVMVLVRNDVVNAGTYVEVMDYGAVRKIGEAAATTPTHGWQTYGGKVANHYSAANYDLVYTGGLNNTQFKYAVSWGSGTTTYYIRCTGWWTRA